MQFIQWYLLLGLGRDFRLDHLQWRECISVFPQLTLWMLQSGPHLHRICALCSPSMDPAPALNQTLIQFENKTEFLQFACSSTFSKVGSENGKIILLLILSPSLIYTKIKEISKNELTHTHNRTLMSVRPVILYHIPTLSMFF